VDAASKSFAACWPSNYLTKLDASGHTELAKATNLLMEKLQDDYGKFGFYPGGSDHNEVVKTQQALLLRHQLEELGLFKQGGRANFTCNIKKLEEYLELEEQYLSALTLAILYTTGIPPRFISLAKVKAVGKLEDRGLFINSNRQIVMRTWSKKNSKPTISILPEHLGWELIHYLVILRPCFQVLAKDHLPSRTTEIQKWEQYLFCTVDCVPWDSQQISSLLHQHSKQIFGFPFKGSFLRQVGTRLYRKYLISLSPSYHKDEAHEATVARIGGHSTAVTFFHYGRSNKDHGMTPSEFRDQEFYHLAWQHICGVGDQAKLPISVARALKELPQCIQDLIV
jgi:hypothetical protein